MNEWVWVPLAALYVVHDRQIALHGGSPGTRDPTLLERGCTRTMNRAACQDADVFSIAAAYAYGLAKAHAFVDGNKRTAFVAAFAFLRLNGVNLRPDPGKGVRIMEGFVADQVSEEAFSGWLRDLAANTDEV